ncbi:cell cycle regulator of non-homologous end joining isoform X5 [Pseudorca crassidens]|uniref:cell cycle regulator of non-homologous end joining isoform X5 n=2 Tax=Pseudorca crassidens TaxID=82174 RepID=UPI00352E593F
MWSRRDCQDPGQRGRRLPSAGESGLYSRGRRQRDLPTGAAPGPPRPRAAGSRKCGDAAEPGEGSRCARGRVTVRAGSEPGRPGSEFPTTAQSQTPGPAPEAKKGARARRQEGLLEERRGRGRCCCRLPAMRTVYCMNEAEIVDVALGILIEGRKQEKPLEQLPLAGADKPEQSPASSAPPSPSPRGSRSEDSEDEDCGEDGPPPGPAGSDSACGRELEEDQDALKYVREIFFS